MIPAPRTSEAEGEQPYMCASLHPAWIEFMRFCQQMRHGEIDQLKIQDGLPMLAEMVRQKVKFSK